LPPKVGGRKSTENTTAVFPEPDGTGAGAGVGLAASLGLTRCLETLLFEAEPADPAVCSGVAILMLAVASRRAAGLDPVIALRDQ